MSVPVRERLTLANQWERVAAKALRPGTSAVQRQEMRRAFYAGAAAWADLMIRGLDGTPGDGDSEPTREDLDYMTALHQELEDFANALRAGRA